MDEKDLQNINEIDLDCACYDEDDDSFGCVKNSAPKASRVILTQEADDEDDYEEAPINTAAEPVRKTGIIINLNDNADEVEVKTLKPLIVQTEQDIMNAANGIIGQHGFENAEENGFDGFNDIDLECHSCEDEDDDFVMIPKEPQKRFVFEDEEEDDFDNKELVSEEMLEERKQKATPSTSGKVEADYWKKLQKKHAASNKKGAYEASFHLAGDPKREMELLNHDLKPAGSPKATSPDGTVSLTGVATPSAIGTGTASGGGEAAGGGDGGGCSEALIVQATDNDSAKLLQDIFNIIGFDVIQNSDGSYAAFDNCDENNSFDCNNKSELFNNLKPYIDDCFLYPLEIQSGKKFNTYNDICDWYTPEVEKQYPKCKEDVKYCQFLKNCF